MMLKTVNFIVENGLFQNSEISLRDVALNFSPSGHITRDIREMARLAIFPNFSSATLQKNFVYP